MWFRNILKWVKRVFIFIISLVIGYFVLAVLFSGLKTHPQKLNCSANNEIFITSNGVHLDIVIPVEILNTDFCKKLELLPGTAYVAFGWGDRRFYLNTPEWKDLTFPTAVNALFLNSKAAMHVTFYRKKYGDWNTIKLCPSQYDKLQKYIENSFRVSLNGSLMKIPVNGYFGNDFFYEANGSFSLFKTCNVWVNRALKTAGITTALWSPFDFGVLYHLPS